MKMNRLIQLGITDHLDPEVQAMLAAMYSRSYAPIASRLPSTEEDSLSHKKKLGQFYVGYNHKSVGQLASTTIWLEGVSQLAAKAIENHPLYNGQESSTRYITFATQPMETCGDPEIVSWQETFRAFYVKALPLVIEKIEKEFPFDAPDHAYSHTEEELNKKHIIWKNTCKARAFDICRGILPAGCLTNVAFTGTFDTINDHFGEMLYHPCEEMRDIANEALTQLSEKYKYAAIPKEKLLKTFSYAQDPVYFYQTSNLTNTLLSLNAHAGINPKELSFVERKKFDKFPKHLSSLLKLSFISEIDFGSYRDIHRHRNGFITMPLLTPLRGFNDFYIDNLPTDLRQDFIRLIDKYQNWYDKNVTGDNKHQLQYCTPMGCTVNFEYLCDLNQTLYILELRSGKTVHQSLRKVIHNWANEFKIIFPNIALHVDWDEDNFSLKRGTQTITGI
jgi:thymidylate synthase ThyX